MAFTNFILFTGDRMGVCISCCLLNFNYFIIALSTFIRYLFVEHSWNLFMSYTRKWLRSLISDLSIIIFGMKIIPTELAIIIAWLDLDTPLIFCITIIWANRFIFFWNIEIAGAIQFNFAFIRNISRAYFRVSEGSCSRTRVCIRMLLWKRSVNHFRNFCFF